MFQCTFCDIGADGMDDQVFDTCKERRHQILEFPSHACNEQAETGFPERLSRLENTVNAQFSGRAFALLVCLSVKAQMHIEGVTQVIVLIIMGNPSSYKSTILEIMTELDDTYVSDSFTPKSFVSHSANSKKKDLEKVDLLPRIRHKTLITPELAPLFSGNPDQLIEYFGMLTRILDGRGFQSDSGVHGKRGYSGDYSFTWLGAVIDIPHRVWKLLGNLGPKMYFLRLPGEKNFGEEKIDEIRQTLRGKPYSEKIKICKNEVREFWKLVQNSSLISNKKIIWMYERDDEQTIRKIIKLSMLLAKLRAVVPTWHTSEPGAGGANYNFETPIEENPSRASSALYNLARGHAVINGRNYVTKDDLVVVIPVTLSSAPKERVDLFRLLIESNGSLNTNGFMRAAGVSRATARKEMQKLVKIGLADEFEEQTETKPVLAIRLKSEFDWFLSEEFLGYWNMFKSLLTSGNSKLSQENLEKKRLSEVQLQTTNKTNTLDAYEEVQN